MFMEVSKKKSFCRNYQLKNQGNGKILVMVFYPNFLKTKSCPQKEKKSLKLSCVWDEEKIVLLLRINVTFVKVSTLWLGTYITTATATHVTQTNNKW